MKCDCCMKNFKSEDLVNFGELIVCEQCRKKVKKCPLCGQYYFSFEGMPIVIPNKEFEVCYDCYLEN